VNEQARAELEHELKTPLAVIAGYAELLARRDDEETRTTAAEQIAAAARRLSLALDELIGADPDEAAAKSPREPGRRVGARARVVVIDDDAFLRRLLRSTLAADEFEIAEAGDGEVALAVIDAQPPQLVLLDWCLPEVTGEVVLTELRQRHPGVAVLVLTVDGRQRERAAELGADAFLTKPFSPIELLHTVERLCAAPRTVEAVEAQLRERVIAFRPEPRSPVVD
jgi:CheY-like chemotaxis protein